MEVLIDEVATSASAKRPRAEYEVTVLSFKLLSFDPPPKTQRLFPTSSKMEDLDFHTRSLRWSISQRRRWKTNNLTYKPGSRRPAIPQSVTLSKHPTLSQLGIDRQTHIGTGGPDLSDLRGVCCPNFLMCSSLCVSPWYANMPLKKTSERKAERNTTAYDKNFWGITYGSRISETLELGHTVKAWQMERIDGKKPGWLHRTRLQGPAALGEMTIITGLFPLVSGNAPILHEQDILFVNLDPLIPGIADAKPDWPLWCTIQLKRHIRQSID